MDFTLHIELGNEAMQTGADVADALRAVADRLDLVGSLDGEGGGIRDLNGNTIGNWLVEA